VFCKKEDKLLGSARSVDGVNLQEILKNETLSDYIVEYGGHEQAAGISIKQEAFDDFKTEVASQVTIDTQDEEVTDEELIIDEIISLEHINGATYDLINEIPYDNRTFPTPVFALADIKVVNTSFSKKNPNNICFEFMEGRVKKSMWAWGFADKYKSIGSPKTVHVAGIVDRDFMKPNCFTLKIMDIIPA
jgi:single-stranded-DNA-specific exonuclease